MHCRGSRLAHVSLLLLLVAELRNSCVAFVTIQTTVRADASSLRTMETDAAYVKQQGLSSAIVANSSKTAATWMREGLLFSSFSQGLLAHPAARDCLRRGLLRCVLTDARRVAEDAVTTSVRTSPCNGPCMDALQRLEACDQALRVLASEGSLSVPGDVLLRYRAVVQSSATLPLRFVYIPTAMYALRPDSSRTPGQQRQRARADGKQRRDEIVGLLRELLGNTTTPPIAAVTLDLDDGSIRHPHVTSTTPAYSHSRAVPLPTNGKAALCDWQPHLVYIQGGNTFWLQHCLEKGNWSNDLRQLLQSDATFYCGVSAGAIVAGAAVETACWKGWDDPSVAPDRPRAEDWTGVPGLRLVGDFRAVFPHYAPDVWATVVAEGNARLRARTGGGEVLCLRDDQVCHVDGMLETATIL